MSLLNDINPDLPFQRLGPFIPLLLPIMGIGGAIGFYHCARWLGLAESTAVLLTMVVGWLPLFALFCVLTVLVKVADWLSGLRGR